MRTTHLRRLVRLEVAVATPDDVADESWRWLDDADPAVIAYATQVLMWAAENAVSVEAFSARHPALWDIWQRYTGFARFGIMGTPTLVQVQARVLWQARIRLLDAIAEELGGYRPPAHELSWERMLGIPATVSGYDIGTVPNGFLMAQDEGAFVRQWRATGTRDPDRLATMRLWGPECELLEAAEARP